MNSPISIPCGLDFATPLETAKRAFESPRDLRTTSGNCFGLLRISINRTFALLCSTVAIASAAFGQPTPEFAKANQDFAQGRFKEAIAGYETLVRSGEWNANLFYDLGNAYFRT